MSKQKNIVFINPGQFGYKAGYYYYCKYLANDKNFNISFVCFDQNLPKLEIPNVKVKYVDFSGSSILRYLRWLKAVFEVMKKDKKEDTIFFMVYFKLCFVFALLFPKKLKVLDIRTGSISNNPAINWLQNQQYRFESLFFKHITILSKGLIKHIGINPRKCHWLPLGSEILSTTNKNFNSLNLIYVGTFNGRRIHDTVEGLGIYINEHNRDKFDVTYDIFGFGTDNEIKLIEETIKKHKLQNIVKLHGRKNHVELIPYLNRCNIGVAYVPITDYYKYQPATKIIEYVLSGLVCIATNTHENKYLINSINGILCNDTARDFALKLNELSKNLKKLDSQTIRNSLIQHEWQSIVNLNLKPFINSIN